MTDPINHVKPTICETLNDYQVVAISSAIYPGQETFFGLVYTTLKMNGEAGEIAEKVGKLLRDDKIQPNSTTIPAEKRGQLLKELGDVLWYVAASAKELGFTLHEVANANIEKLASRSARGKLSGSGDNR